MKFDECFCEEDGYPYKFQRRFLMEVSLSFDPYFQLKAGKEMHLLMKFKLITGCSWDHLVLNSNS